MLRRLLQISVTILTFVAFSNIASACSILGYQPEVPQFLRDE